MPTLLTAAEDISPVFLASATGGLLTRTPNPEPRTPNPEPGPGPGPKPLPGGLLFIMLIVGTVVTNFGIMKK